MIQKRTTFRPTYFDALYASDSDPWKLASSGYEREKYAITVASLPKPHYQSAFEIGCSIGVLTQKLAARCDRLLAIDAALASLIEARRRCAKLPNVRIDQMFVPDEWPDDAFDLILLSEVVYFMDEQDVARLTAQTAHCLRPSGNVVLVHWTGATNYPLSGDEAAELFIDMIGPAVNVVSRSRYDAFRIDVLMRE